jgi:hypothetical protein
LSDDSVHKQALRALMEYGANRDYRNYEREPTRTTEVLFLTHVDDPEPDWRVRVAAAAC